MLAAITSLHHATRLPLKRVTTTVGVRELFINPVTTNTTTTTTTRTITSSSKSISRSISTTTPNAAFKMSTSTSGSATKKEITIIGGGIIGCSAAYFLTRHPSYSPATHQITLLEAAATSSGGRTADSRLQDAADLPVAPDAEGQGQQPQPRNPAHDGIAGGASGKAGGLLALWAFPQNIVPLSFRLHEELAREHGGAARWGYRRCHAGQVECRARLPPAPAPSAAASSPARKKAADDKRDGDEGDDEEDDEVEEEAEEDGDEDDEAKPTASRGKGLHNKVDDSDAAARKKKLAALGAPADLDWIDPSYSLLGYEGMGTPADTAQVHPELFTRSMAQLAEDAGVRIVTGARVTSINTTTSSTSSNDESKPVESVTYIQQDSQDEITLPTTDAIIAAGPWTSRLLPQIPVTASRAHSVVVRTTPPPPHTGGVGVLSPYALFTSIALPAGFPEPTTGGRVPLRRAAYAEPEIYARPDGTAYACGPTDASEPLPETTAEVRVDEARCADIAAQIAAVSAQLGGKGGEVIAKQACYLPQGGPFIGPVPGLRGAIVAAGHTCWGIQNAPATGKLVSELVLEGKARSARLGGCDPARIL